MVAGLCERVGCGEPQVCALLIAPQETQAWLVSPSHQSASEGVSLCDTHADRISVPFGWTLVDDRAHTKRKRRKKKAEPTPVTAVDLEPSADEPAPSLPTEPDAESDVSDGYVEPEYQFREDGAGGLGDDAPAVEVTEVTDVTSTDQSTSVPPDVGSEAGQMVDAVDDPEPRLSVVSGDDPDGNNYPDDDRQGALWDSPEPDETEPDETTPLLQRAFRVVRDD